MSAFDPHSRANFPFLDFMKDKRALIADSSAGNRPVLRRMLSQLGMKSQNVDIAENFDEAEQKMRSLRPNFVFTDFDLNDKSHTGLDLFPLLREQFPGYLESAFFISAEGRNNLIAAEIAEKDVDAVLQKPYSYASLEDTVVSVLKAKLSPSEYAQCIDNGRIFLQQGQVKEALQNFQYAKGLDPKPYLACLFMARTMLAAKNFDLARKLFEEALVHAPNNYLILTAFFEFLIEQKDIARAYEVGSRIWQSFPILPSRLPLYLRAIIQTGHFADVERFYDVLGSDGKLDESNVNFLAAALVTSGKYFLKQGDKTQGSSFLKKGLIIGKGRLKVFKEVVGAFLDAGLSQDALDLLSGAPKEIKESKEICLLEFEHTNRTCAPDKVVQMGMNLVNQGVLDPRIYELLILRSIDMKRRPDAIEEIVHRATKHFPEKRQFFESLLNAPTPSQPVSENPES